MLFRSLFEQEPELPEVILKLSEHRVFTSFVEGQGLDTLYDKVEEVIWQETNHEAPDFSLNARHAALLSEANKHIKTCCEMISGEQWELVAINLKGALHELGEVLGETVLPDILHNIFAKYCIGK